MSLDRLAEWNKGVEYRQLVRLIIFFPALGQLVCLNGSDCLCLVFGFIPLLSSGEGATSCTAVTRQNSRQIAYLWKLPYDRWWWQHHPWHWSVVKWVRVCKSFQACLVQCSNFIWQRLALIVNDKVPCIIMREMECLIRRREWWDLYFILFTMYVIKRQQTTITRQDRSSDHFLWLWQSY